MPCYRLSSMVGVYGILFVCYAWSFSITTNVVLSFSYSIPPLSSHHVNTGHCMSKGGNDGHYQKSNTHNFNHNRNNEADIIRSVTKAKSTQEVDERLRQAFNEQNFETTATMPGVAAVPIKESIKDSTKHHSVEVVISLNETTIAKTMNMFPSFSMEVLAATLRRLAVLSAKEIQHHPLSFDEETETPLLQSLLETIGHQMMAAQRDQGLLGVYSLADILQALTILSFTDAFMQEDEQEEGTSLLLDQLIDSTVSMLTRHDVSELKTLGPIRLLQCVQAMAKLGMRETILHYRVYKQLLKPNASSRLPAKYLSHGLDAIAILFSNRLQEEDDDEEREDGQHSDLTLLARSFMRRLRKEKVREDATIEDFCRALMATNDLWHCGALQDLEDEAAIFGFTTIRAILRKKDEENLGLSPSQMATILSSWATLTNKKKEDAVIEELLTICESDHIIERASLWQLERIISAIEELQITNHADLMKNGGKRLELLAKEGKISPRSFNAVLRCPTLLHRRDTSVMEPYIRACEHAFVDASFLEKCYTSEIANFLWFASVVNWRHEAVLKALGRRATDPHLSEKCSPKLASRILATYTSVISLPVVEDSISLSTECLNGITSNLFHQYGGHLLTRNLSSAEVSSSLYAYARASYFHDMGIVDHLLSLMAEKSQSSQQIPTTRQMTQSLWSCGKMSALESNDRSNGQKVNNRVDVTYSKSAHTIAKVISHRVHDLNKVDITQCIWSLGRLYTADNAILSPFVDRAMLLASEFNAVEISNILWGLSRTRHSGGALVATLANRLMEKSVNVSPTDAATCLYALGRMKIADDDLYSYLSDIMMSRIDETSAQGIANTLWAYQNVGMKPPPELLNEWTVQKLGLVSFNPKAL